MKRSRIIRNTFYAQFTVSIVSALTQMIGSIVDGIIIGQFLGVEAMAAFGLISPLMVVFSLSGSIVSTGSRNRFTRLIGEGRQREAQGVFSLSVLLSVGTAVLFMLLIIIFSMPFTRILGASGSAAELLPMARAYLIGIALGLPAMNAMQILSNYMAIDNDMKLPVMASTALTVCDIVLDLAAVFIFHGGTFEMGLATSLSYYAGAAVLMTHFFKKDIILKFSIHDVPWKETAGIIMQGIPIGVCRIGYTLRTTYMNRLLAAAASASAIAAYSVQRQADDILCCLAISMADTVAMLAGILMGEENRLGMKSLLSTSIHATEIITVGTAALTWLLAPQFSSLYISGDPEALMLSVRAVRAYAIGLPIYCLSMIYFNYFQGIGRSKLSAISGFLSESAFLILSAWVMSFKFGADAVWFSFPVTQVLMLIYYVILIRIESFRLNIRHGRLWDKILLLPMTFDVSDEDHMDRSLHTMEEVSDLSQAVWKFCEKHGCDERRKYLMALSVEEMAGNIITHGFTKSNKDNNLEVRILKKGDQYIVRIRDDCPIFDPAKQIKLFSTEDPSHHMGLRLMFKMAHEVKYNCILKLNNLVIRV